MDSERRRISRAWGHFIVVVWMWLVCSVMLLHPSHCTALCKHWYSVWQRSIISPALVHKDRSHQQGRERKWASVCFIPYVLILGHKGGALSATQFRLAGVYWSGCEFCQQREKERASNNREQKNIDRERNGTEEKRKRGKSYRKVSENKADLAFLSCQ